MILSVLLLILMMISISDLVFPGTITGGDTVVGSVAYQGEFSLINNPIMAMQLSTTGSVTTSFVFCLLQKLLIAELIFPLVLQISCSWTNVTKNPSASINMFPYNELGKN